MTFSPSTGLNSPTTSATHMQSFIKKNCIHSELKLARYATQRRKTTTQWNLNVVFIELLLMCFFFALESQLYNLQSIRVRFSNNVSCEELLKQVNV